MSCSSNWFAGVAVPAAGVFLTSTLAGQVTVAERKATSWVETSTSGESSRVTGLTSSESRYFSMRRRETRH